MGSGGSAGRCLPFVPYIRMLLYFIGVDCLKSLSKKITPYLFILPTFIFLIIFFYYSFYFAVERSFTDYTIGYTPVYVGLDNYIQLLQDKVFLKSLMNQAIIIIYGLLSCLTFPLMAAELLYFVRHRAVSEIIKKAFVIPMLIPSLVVLLIWKFLYNPNFGINNLLDIMGLSILKHDWVNENGYSLFAVLFTNFPYVAGLYFLIFHTAVNSISKELHEASVIDGCTSFGVFRYIHLPGIRPYLNVVSILTIIGCFQNFGTVYTLTKGGPGYASYIPALYMFTVGISDQRMGYACSIGMLLFIMIIILTLISQRITKSR